MTSSRTDEGSANHCPVCGQDIQLEPSTVPVRDAPCPRCGCLLWFDDPTVTKIQFSTTDETNIFFHLNQWVGRVHECNLLIDFGTVRFLSGTSVGQLMTLARKATASGGRVVFCNVDRDIREVFHVTRLDRLLEIRP